MFDLVTSFYVPTKKVYFYSLVHIFLDVPSNIIIFNSLTFRMKIIKLWWILMILLGRKKRSRTPFRVPFYNTRNLLCFLFTHPNFKFDLNFFPDFPTVLILHLHNARVVLFHYFRNTLSFLFTNSTSLSETVKD